MGQQQKYEERTNIRRGNAYAVQENAKGQPATGSRYGEEPVQQAQEAMRTIAAVKEHC